MKLEEFMVVYIPSNTANIDYVTIASGGDAIDWGADRTTSAQQQGALATSTRGLFFGGASTNVIDYIEIQTTGNAQDFGDLSTAGSHMNHCCDAHGGLIQ